MYYGSFFPFAAVLFGLTALATPPPPPPGTWVSVRSAQDVANGPGIDFSERNVVSTLPGIHQ
jgi:hypothetical protein